MFASQGIIIIIALIIIVAITFRIFYKKNKKLFRDISDDEKKLSDYKQLANQLKISSLQNSEDDFKKLNKLARDFFKEYFNMPQSKTYLELEKDFIKQDKKEYANFCKGMSDINYTGKKSNKLEVRKLIETFYNLVNKF